MLKKYTKLQEKEIGSGTYGIVWKCKDIDKNITVALKQMKPDPRDEGLSITSVHEIGVLLELKHPNIVDLYDFFFDEIMEDMKKSTYLFLVFEYGDQDLTKYMTENPNMKMRTIRNFVYQILKGLEFCHRHHILHRDMKPQNIFVTNDEVIKLGDFGLARLNTINDRNFTSEVVTLWYRAPEILLGTLTYDAEIDIWSTGAIFGEMLKNDVLFKGRCNFDQLYNIFNLLGYPTNEVWDGVENLPFYIRDFPKLKPKNLSSQFVNAGEDCLDLLSKMLIYQPNKRITAAEALKHPFFAQLEQK